MDFLSRYWLDITTTVLGLLYILLEYRASIKMWYVGFVMQVLGMVLYYQKGLYADCGMEFYYTAMTVYGYCLWRGWLSKDGKAERPITHIPRLTAAAYIAGTGVLWLLIWWLLVEFTDSRVPVCDSFTTALSIAGTLALAHKWLEQWLIWIVVDVVTCGLYYYKDIPFKASLYGLYVVIAVMGYRKWRRDLSHASR